MLRSERQETLQFGPPAAIWYPDIMLRSTGCYIPVRSMGCGKCEMTSCGYGHDDVKCIVAATRSARAQVD